MVLNDRVYWICFHGNQDFAYLLRTLTNDQLPQDKRLFQNLLGIFFPNVYDIKTITPQLSPILEGGLNRLADSMNIQRIGSNHQAGSDSLTTSKVFFKLKQSFPTIFNQTIQDNNGDIYGYNNDQSYYRPGATVVPSTSSIQIPD